MGNAQIGLSFAIDEEPPPTKKPLTKRERFERFHGDHPEIYVEFLRVVREEKSRAQGARRGRVLFGSGCARNFNLGRPGRESYKLNDHYITYYAQMAMEREPDLRGYFEVRRPQGVRRKKAAPSEDIRWRAPRPDCSDWAALGGSDR